MYVYSFEFNTLRRVRNKYHFTLNKPEMKWSGTCIRCICCTCIYTYNLINIDIIIIMCTYLRGPISSYHFFCSGKGRGLYYLKGGDFLAELTNDAQVSEYALHEVCQLVPNLQTDKNVLFIPQTEIAAFNARQIRQHSKINN